MVDTIKEIETIAEEVTNTATPEASAATLIGWFVSLFQHIAGSANPAEIAAVHADEVAANQDKLVAAVVANP
jgi:hypothetical protein